MFAFLVAGEASTCQSHYDQGFKLSGIFIINPSGNSSFLTMCEMNKKEIQKQGK